MTVRYFLKLADCSVELKDVKNLSLRYTVGSAFFELALWTADGRRYSVGYYQSPEDAARTLRDLRDILEKLNKLQQQKVVYLIGGDGSLIEKQEGDGDGVETR